MSSSDAASIPTRGALGWYDSVMRALAGGSMAVVVVIMLVQVVARYGFNASLIWAEELCRYILIWQSFLFIGLAFRMGELVAVDTLTNFLPAKLVYLLRLLVAIPILTFLVLMIKNGWLHASRFDKQTIPAVDFIWMSLTGRPAGLTVIWIYISVAIGMALLAMHFVVSLWNDGRALFFPAAAHTTTKAR